MGPLLLDELLRCMILGIGGSRGNFSPGLMAFSLGISFPLWILSVRSQLVLGQTTLPGLFRLLSKGHWRESWREIKELYTGYRGGMNVLHVLCALPYARNHVTLAGW